MRRPSDLHEHLPRRATPTHVTLLGGYDVDRPPQYPSPTPQDLRRAAYELQAHHHGECRRRPRVA